MGSEIRLEDKLSKGFFASVNDTQDFVFPVYSEEIAKAINEDRKRSVPFVNQEETFLRFIRSIAFENNYSALFGQSGIGKSKMLKYLVSAMNGEKTIEEISSEIPQAVELIQKIKEKIRSYSRLEHVLLPNLFFPNDVVCLPYYDSKSADSDLKAIQNFCSDMNAKVGSYNDKDCSSFRKTMTEDRFRNYARFLIDDFYHNVYRTVRTITLLDEESTETEQSDEEFKKFKKDSSTYSIEIKFPESVSKNQKINCKVSFTPGSEYQLFNKECGYENDTDTNCGQIESGIKKEIVEQIIGYRRKELLRKIQSIEIDKKYDPKKAYSIFVEELSKSQSPKVLSLIAKGYFKTQGEIVEYLSNSPNSFRYEFETSEYTIDSVVERIDEIRKKYLDSKSNASEKAREWMGSVCDFLSDRSRLKSALEVVLNAYENQKRDSERDILLPGKKGETYNLTEFGLAFDQGESFFFLEDLLKANHLGNRALENYKKITVPDFNPISFFGKFSEEKIPHHMRFLEKGSFFGNGMIVFDDSFNRFLSYISDDTYEANMVDLMAEYIQTGQFTVMNLGVKFRMYNPQIIVGCDNKNPFDNEDYEECEFAKDLKRIENRINLIQVPDVAENIATKRAGSFKIILDAINSFNAKHSSNLRIDENAMNLALWSTSRSNFDYISLNYQQLEKRIEELCEFANAKKTEVITEDIYLERISENYGPKFFLYIDFEKEKQLSLPEKAIGSINGLAVTTDDYGKHGTCFLVKSYNTNSASPRFKKKEHLFENVDIKTDLATGITNKGYSLAVNYLERLLNSMERGIYRSLSKSNMTIQTFFEDSDDTNGPSASTAIAASILSEISGREIYHNRYITGTLNAHDGRVGLIGGEYFKGTVPMRVYDLSGGKRDMYFLFPEENIKTFKEDILFDPFGMRQKITCLPVGDFMQAFYLLTCGPVITNNDWMNSKELGKRLFKELAEGLDHRYAGRFTDLSNLV